MFIESKDADEDKQKPSNIVIKLPKKKPEFSEQVEAPAISSLQVPLTKGRFASTAEESIVPNTGSSQRKNRFSDQPLPEEPSVTKK